MAETNYHVERRGTLLYTAVARYEDGKAWDAVGDGGWDPCYHAENTMETDETHGPLQLGDLIVAQINPERVYVRRYTGVRTGMFSQRFERIPPREVGYGIEGKVGTPVYEKVLKWIPYIDGQKYLVLLESYDRHIAFHKEKLAKYEREKAELVAEYRRQFDARAEREEKGG